MIPCNSKIPGRTGRDLLGGANHYPPHAGDLNESPKIWFVQRPCLKDLASPSHQSTPILLRACCISQPQLRPPDYPSHSKVKVISQETAQLPSWPETMPPAAKTHRFESPRSSTVMNGPQMWVTGVRSFGVASPACVGNCHQYQLFDAY